MLNGFTFQSGAVSSQIILTTVERRDILLLPVSSSLTILEERTYPNRRPNNVQLNGCDRNCNCGSPSFNQNGGVRSNSQGFSFASRESNNQNRSGVRPFNQNRGGVRSSPQEFNFVLRESNNNRSSFNQNRGGTRPSPQEFSFVSRESNNNQSPLNQNRQGGVRPNPPFFNQNKQAQTPKEAESLESWLSNFLCSVKNPTNSNLENKSQSEKQSNVSGPYSFENWIPIDLNVNEFKPNVPQNEPKQPQFASKQTPQNEPKQPQFASKQTPQNEPKQPQLRFAPYLNFP